MANLTISMPTADKTAITEFCDATGLSISSLFNVFTKAVIRERRVPFAIIMPPTPNRETIAAMEEGNRLIHDKKAKSYSDLGQLWKDLEK